MATLGLASLLTSPPTALTQLEHISGAPVTGPGIVLLDRVRGPIGTDAFGFAWTFLATPAGVGRTVGRNVTDFDETLAQVLEVKTDITSTTLNGELYYIARDEGRQMFSEFPITRISVWVAPATTIDLFWILIF